MQLDELRSKYRGSILALANKYHADNVRVFGSVARGEATEESDIDFLVHFKSGASLLDESGLDRELHELLGRSIDLIGDDVVRTEFKPFIFNESIPL